MEDQNIIPEETTEEIVQPKPKKKLSQQQLEHLERIRVRALEKKKEMKQLTEKANKMKELESEKLKKQLQKEHLAKKYEEHLEQATKEKVIEKPIEKEVDKPIEKTKKKKIIKTVIYEQDSTDEDSEPEVIIKKVPKQKPQPLPPQEQQNKNSYSNLVNESSLDKIKQHMMDEHCKHILSSVTPFYS